MICSTYHTLNDKSTSQLLFGHDIINPIYKIVDWLVLSYHNQSQIYVYSNCKNKLFLYYGYQVGWCVIISYNQSRKYETAFKLT